MEILSKIEDPRTRKPDYPLSELLAAVVLAFLRGTAHMNQVPGFLRSLHHKQLKRIGFTKGVPDESSFRRVLGMLDFQQVEKLLSPWLASEGLQGMDLALDGKRQRGAHHSGERPPEMLNIVEQGTGRVVGQSIIDKDGGERQALKRFVAANAIKGTLISADALHTSDDLMQTIVEKGAEYFLYVKKNQPTSWAVIENMKLDERRAVASASTVEISKGREEVREIYVTSRYCKERSQEPIFPGAGMIGTIVRTITNIKNGKVTRERIHFVTSFSKVAATPEELLQYARGQWTVEAKNHYVKDTTMGEDRCRCRRKSLPQVLGTLRNVALKILREVQITFCRKKGRDTIPEAMRYLERNGGACSVLEL